MPGEISRSATGTPDHAPYVPSWNYPNSEPKVCPCGHHEGYHNSDGQCLHAHHFDKCACTGLPKDCFTSDEAFVKSPLPCSQQPER